MGYLGSACGFVLIDYFDYVEVEEPNPGGGWQLEEMVGWRSAS